MATLLEIAARLQAAGAVESMLWIVAKATVVLAIARLLLAAMPRAAAATKHAVATAALVAVAAMPVVTFVLPAWNIAVKMAEPAAATPTPTPSESGGARTVGATDAEPAATSDRPSTLGTAINLARATGVVPAEPLTVMERAMNISKSTWKGMILVALGLVSLLMLGQMAVGMFGVWHVARKAEELTHDVALRELDDARDQLKLRRDVRLLRSGRISVPVIWGVFKPVLLLPADVVTWPAERLRVVLLHELAHSKRFDGISLILTRLAASIFWYHPLVWSLERAGRSECERACDDLVLASGTKPSDYADHLLAIARNMPTFDPFRSVTLAMSRKSQLEGRLLSILQPHVARRVLSGTGVAVACALAIAVIVPVSALRLKAENAKKSDIVPAITKTDASVTVTPDLQAIEDYFLTKLGKYDKRADKLLRTPTNGKEWYERAYDLYNNDRYEEAATAFKQAANEGYSPAKSIYNAACSYALLGDAQRSTDMLEQAIDAGWDDFDHIADDSDFDPIRNDRRFQTLVNRAANDIATRRVTETLDRYESLKDGVADGVAGGIADGISEGIQQGLKEGLHEGLVEGLREAFGDKDNDWYDVGLDLLRLRQIDKSIDAFEKSIAEGEKVGSAMYNIACAYSLKGDARSGMQWLEKSIENGYGDDGKLQHDPDIALLRTQPGFDEIRQKAKDLEMRGCCDDDDHQDDERAGWREVAKHHRQIAARYPDSGRAWFNLGFTALQARDFATGHDAFQKAIGLNYRVGTSSYNIACGYALQGNRDAAFQWLERAKAEGFELGNYIDGDDDLDSLHDDPRWNPLRREVKANRHWKQKSK